MADSTYLKFTVEPFVVQWISEQIGNALKPRRMPVGARASGELVHFAFDGVSADGAVGLLVSTSLTIKPGGTRKLHVDASVLLQTPFRRRLMAFISEDVRQHFVNTCDGLLPLGGIEMFVCKALPRAMSAQIDKFQAQAKAEVGDQGRIWKPAGQRR